jgi:hypothetical protein
MSTAIVDLKPLDSRLAEFSSYVTAIEVKTKEQYAEVSVRVKEAKNEIRKIGFVLDPGIASAKEHLDFLKNQKQGFVSKWEAQIQIGDGKAKKWLEDDERQRRQEQERVQKQLADQQKQKADEERRANEKLAAENRKKRVDEINGLLASKQIGKREAARLLKEAGANEEAEKELIAAQAEETANNVPEVRVETSRPKIAGVPRTMHYFCEVTDEKAIIDAFVNGPAAQRQFLRRFITVDVSEVGKYARDTKNSEQVQKEIPGVRAWNNY